jgi:hypothetical protein
MEATGNVCVDISWMIKTNEAYEWDIIQFGRDKYNYKFCIKHCESQITNMETLGK